MSTLVPRQPYTDEELRQLYPSGLELQLVQVLMRHGERTPVSPRFQNAGLHPFWPYCAAVRQFKANVLTDEQDPGLTGPSPTGSAAKPLSTLAWKRRLETFGAGDAAQPAAGPSGELDALCDLGMLTDTGRRSTLRLGQRLRTLYVERLGFLPATLRTADGDPAAAVANAERLLFLRTTPIPRSLQSLQQAFVGLYPDWLLQTGQTLPLTIVSREPADETLFPNDSNCRRFAALSQAFAQRAADRWNDSPELAHATRMLAPWLPAESPRVAVDGKPRLSGIMDTINATRAHGPATRLPAAFYDPQTQRNIATVALDEWYSGYAESREYRMLGIGAMAGDLTARMVARVHAQAKAQKGDADDAGPFRFGLYGCHDTTLAALLSSLGYQMPAWPPFTSHIAVELFRKKTKVTAPASSGWSSLFSSFAPSAADRSVASRKLLAELSDGDKKALDGYYVRVRYNDDVVTVPSCRAAGKHLDGDESFCTLEAFKAVVDKFTPANWKLSCRTNLGASAFPEKPEPAGV